MFHSIKKAAAGLLALAALGLGGSALAQAASSGNATAAAPRGANAPTASQMPVPGMAAHEGAEKTVTGDAATKAQAAAVKSVGGGSAGAVTTDCFGNGYEVVVTKSDGAKVEVHLDSSFSVMQAPGGQRRPGAPGAPPPINQ